MSLLELAIIAVGLSMDAFAVAVCRGLTVKKATLKGGLVVGLYFGVFQAAMPLLGYLLGSQFAKYIQSVDHWIAFVLLGIIGGKMVWESRKADDEAAEQTNPLGPRAMLPLAVATSIDALAVGVSFAFLEVNILPAVGLIGVTTLVLSLIGFKAGGFAGKKLQARAEMIGGGLLILMGLKILLQHLGVINF